MKDLICIDPAVGKLIGPYESGLLKGADRERFELHLISCAYCFNQAFQTQPVIANLRMKAPTMVTQMSPERLTAKAPAAKRLMSLRDPRQWAGLVILVIIVATFGVWLYVQRGRPHLYGLEPSGPQPGAPVELRWRVDPPAGAQFEVEIFDEQKQFVWKDETDRLSLTLDGYTRQQLSRGGKFTWRITGKPDASPQTPFRESATFTVPNVTPSGRPDR